MLPTSASTMRLFMRAPRSLLRASLPRPRLPARLVIQEQHHLPDLALGEEVLPLGHRRIPRGALARQARPTLGDAPEDEALGELRDGAVVLEVGGQRIEARREVAEAVEVIAVAGETVLIVDPLALADVVGERVGVLAQRIVEPGERQRLAPERDLRGRRRMDGAEVGRRLHGGAHLAVGDPAHEQRHDDEAAHAHRLEPRLDHRGGDRLAELAPTRFVVADVDQHAREHRAHVLEPDTRRHDRAAGEQRDAPLDDDERQRQDGDGLPERVLHLCAARKRTSASNCAAVSVVPKVLGMIPANRSYPRAVDDAGSRILVRIDSAERRAPTCERSGPTFPPSAPILWQPTQPAARNSVIGSVLPPPTPPAPVPPPPGGDGGAEAGMSAPVTSTVPPWDSRNAITAQICSAGSCRVITGMIGW